jgi:hypothetical protein
MHMLIFICMPTIPSIVYFLLCEAIATAVVLFWNGPMPWEEMLSVWITVGLLYYLRFGVWKEGDTKKDDTNKR